MGAEKRENCRVNVSESVTLISPNQTRLTATLVDISLTGMLVSDLSASIDQSVEYKIELLSPSGETIFLSGRPVRDSGNRVGLIFTRYRFNSNDLLESLVTDIQVSYELLALLKKENFDDAIKAYQKTAEKDILDDGDR